MLALVYSSAALAVDPTLTLLSHVYNVYLVSLIAFASSGLHEVETPVPGSNRGVFAVDRVRPLLITRRQTQHAWTRPPPSMSHSAAA